MKKSLEYPSYLHIIHSHLSAVAAAQLHLYCRVYLMGWGSAVVGLGKAIVVGIFWILQKFGWNLWQSLQDRSALRELCAPEELEATMLPLCLLLPATCMEAAVCLGTSPSAWCLPPSMCQKNKAVCPAEDDHLLIRKKYLLSQEPYPRYWRLRWAKNHQCVKSSPLCQESWLWRF